MARTIKDIQNAIHEAVNIKIPSLSNSSVAEWRLWAYIMAAAIYSFEVILDVFRKEVDERTNKITPGTSRWYAEMCYRFQNGYSLEYDNQTAMLYYPISNPAAQIVKVVAIKEMFGEARKLVIKAAKYNDKNKIVPLSDDELNNFKSYVDAIKFAGITTNVSSVAEDKVRYSIDVYFDPTIPMATVRDNILNALEIYKTTIDFNSKIYKQQFIDAVMGVKGVVTCELKQFTRKGNSDIDFQNIGLFTELEAGYFEYDAENCFLEMNSLHDIDNAN